jgi:hypothetical protein
MQVLPTAPSPTVTHLMNREALDAMAAAGLAGCPELEEGQGGTGRWCEEGGEGRGAAEFLLRWGCCVWCVTSLRSEEGHMLRTSVVLSVLRAERSRGPTPRSCLSCRCVLVGVNCSSRTCEFIYRGISGGNMSSCGRNLCLTIWMCRWLLV